MSCKACYENLIVSNLTSPHMSIVIQTKKLVKRYGSRTVVNDVSFNVKQGEIVGLLGPNGAGKTTSFYQVVGLVKPDEGEVFLNDINITTIKRERNTIFIQPFRSIDGNETGFYKCNLSSQ